MSVFLAPKQRLPEASPASDDWLEVEPNGISIRVRCFHSASQVVGTALLFAGGNTGGETFLVPAGGLARYLCSRGWDVWLAEWRGSPHVLRRILDHPPQASVEKERALFNLDEAAEKDVVAAMRHVSARRRESLAFAVLGHCLGGAITSMALSRGHLGDFGVTSFVFTTMSLIFKVPWDGWMKAEDYVLERLLSSHPETRAIDPQDSTSWPSPVQDAYRVWPSAWLPAASSPQGQLWRALTFMFGSPFAIDALHPKLQGVELLDLFGPMHLGLYLHVAQNVRRGYSDRFDCPDVIDRPSGGGLCGDLVPTHFARQCVTLIGGSENRLWHRDSLDSMYEWLRSRVGNGRFEKHILPGCGMQEMYWARNPLPVYATIEASFRLRYE